MYAVTASCEASYSRLCSNCLRNIKCVKVVCKKIMLQSLLVWFLGMGKPGFVDSINSIAEHLNILWFPGLTFKLVVGQSLVSILGLAQVIASINEIQKQRMGKNRLKWGVLIQKKHRSSPAKEVFAAKIKYEHISDQSLCPLNGGIPSLILFKLCISQYVESWTVNLTWINNYYYLECSDLHWLN